MRIEILRPDGNDETEEFNLLKEFFWKIYKTSSGNENLRTEDVHRLEMILCGAN